MAFYQLLYAHAWNDIIRIYNERFRDDITVAEAKSLSAKRMRYIFGATPLRISGKGDRSAWKKSAKEFEERHRQIEERMTAWSESQNGNFPLVKTKKMIPFHPGPYFNIFVERLPHYFTDTNCNVLKIGTILRVVSYDPETQYMKLDLNQEARAVIKPNDHTTTPWLSESGDYVVMLERGKQDEALEFIDPLEKSEKDTGIA